MPGQHLSPGKGRFMWEFARYVLAWVAIVAALVGVFWLISNVLPEWLDSSPGATVAATGSGPLTVPTTEAITTTTSTEATTTTTSTSTTTTTTVPPVRPPGEVVVLVLNSTGRAGLAGGATGALDEAGYLTLVPDNYSPALETTRIVYVEGLELEAAELATHFPGAEVLPDEEGLTAADPDLVVILGTDYEP